MSIQRVALISDNDNPVTRLLTAYCRRALGSFVDVKQFHVAEYSKIPRNGFDLYLHIDESPHDHDPSDLKPSAWWLVHTDSDVSALADKAQRFDLVFAARRSLATQLKEAGISSAEWLSFACDPELHCPKTSDKPIELCFILDDATPESDKVFSQVAQRFPGAVAVPCRSHDSHNTILASRVCIDWNIDVSADTRLMEMLAARALVVTRDREDSDFRQIFRDNTHRIICGDLDELTKKVAYYLSNDEERNHIAYDGQKEVVSHHTYLHRFQHLLRRAEISLGQSKLAQSTISSREDAQSQVNAPKRTPRVSACLLSWKRHENILQIVRHLKTHDFIDEVLVWNNNPEVPLQINVPDVKVINSDKNLVTYARFLCAREARNDVIYTQDDDCIVHNIDELWESFQRCPSRITHSLKLGHLLENGRNVYGTAHMALLGWGSFFRKEWGDVLQKYIDVFHTDPLLIRKADRIFTVLLNQRHRTLLANVTDLSGAGGTEALSVRSDHIQLSRVAVSRALSLLEQKRLNKIEATVSEEGERLAVLEQIPATAEKILYIGHRATRAAEQLRQRYKTVVTGTAFDEQAAAAKTESLEQVIKDYRENTEPNSSARPPFDCIILQAALEQTERPDRLLRQIRQWLAADGRLVVEVANVRHHQSVSSLLAGTWSPSAREENDGTNQPLRFFTRREIEKLLYRTGFAVNRCQAVPGPGYEQWQQQGRPGQVDLGPLHIAGLAPNDAEEFYASDWIFQASPVDTPDHGLTSIVILTHNQLPYTQKCLDSISRYTDSRYELIVVDNGSTDGTVEYLKNQPGVKLIANAANRGFPTAANQGMRAAKGDNVLLLNNDVVATTGWLDRLLRALHSDEQIGIVGPYSNNISGYQQIPVSYESLSDLDGFAWEHGKANDGRYRNVDHLVGFCMLIKREVMDKIGLLDEQFGMGCYEDNDYCRRATDAGYQLMVATDAFVHHFGSRTFFGSGIDLNDALKQNEKLFQAKWEKQGSKIPPQQRQPKTDNPAGGWKLEEAPGGGLLLRPKEIRLSLCMIVRDNADTIGPCLDSIKPWVDEMIIVDTGSKDQTPELVRQRGANLHHFPWCDDFSAARNESLKHASGEWIFWMDSDDTIDEESGRKLQQLAAREHDPSVLGHVMQVHCPGSEEDGKNDVTVVDHVKLIRNRPDLRFEGKIHEQVLPAIRRAGGEVEFTDIFVVHSGSDHSPEGHERKLQRDFHLLKLELEDRPDHPFGLFNLGMTHADADQHEEAVEALRRSIQVSQSAESHVRKAYAILIGSLGQLSRHEEAQQACREARQHYPQDLELLFREGVLHHHFKRFEEAEKAYLAVLDNHEPRHFASIDQGVAGYKARHNLAIVYEDMGRPDKAETQWRKVVEDAPTYCLAWRGLVDSLLRQGKLDEALRQSQRLQEDATLGETPLGETLQLEGMILQAKATAAGGELPKAKQMFHNAVDRRPRDVNAKHALCRFLFEHDDPAEAEQPLKSLLDIDPEDGAAHHNLGTVYLRLGRPEDAVNAFGESIRHRPDSPNTHVQLGNALDACGRTDEARSAWREAQRLTQNDPEALVLT